MTSSGERKKRFKQSESQKRGGKGGPVRVESDIDWHG